MAEQADQALLSPAVLSPVAEQADEALLSPVMRVVVAALRRPPPAVDRWAEGNEVDPQCEVAAAYQASLLVQAAADTRA